MIPGENTPGLLIGLTFYKRPVQPDWAVSLAHLVGSLPINTSWGFSIASDAPIAVARNAIAEEALKTKVKYLLFLDDDTAPQNFAVTRLMSILESDPKVAAAGGIYFTKTNPPQPIVARKFGQGPSYDWKLGDVFECQVLGTGCMMIRADVFNHIERPWFAEVNEMNPSENINAIRMTDDCYFLKKVIEAGYKIMADGGTLPIHWDVTTGENYRCPADSPMAQAYVKSLEQPKQKISFTPENPGEENGLRTTERMAAGQAAD